MKVFISYTIRDTEISIDNLQKVKCKLHKIACVYIDLIDIYRSQDKVESELINSNLVILIETENVYKSKWVLKEIGIASKCRIPILKMKLSDLLNMPENYLSKILVNRITHRTTASTL